VRKARDNVESEKKKGAGGSNSLNQNEFLKGKRKKWDEFLL